MYLYVYIRFRYVALALLPDGAIVVAVISQLIIIYAILCFNNNMLKHENIFILHTIELN